MQFDIDLVCNAGTLWVKSSTMTVRNQSAGLVLRGSNFQLYVTSQTLQSFWDWYCLWVYPAGSSPKAKISTARLQEGLLLLGATAGSDRQVGLDRTFITFSLKQNESIFI